MICIDTKQAHSTERYNPTILAFFSQINVVVGAFFVLSGYVQAYVATTAGKREADPKRTGDKAKFIIGRIMGYYPLYLLTQLIFLPMFVYADNFYNGPIKTAFHFLITTSLSQAWFPAHAELWNAPTWFLSAFTFAMVVVPYALEPIAKMSKKSLKICMGVLTATMVAAKTAYSYDLNLWTAMDGLMSARTHPNIMFGNITRFHPFYALIEVLIGVVACRLVMLDGVDGDKENEKAPASPLVPAIAMVGIIVLRTLGYLTLNDHLTRALLFIPLFTLFLMNVHRETIYKPGTGFSKFLAFKPLAYLGTISFPFYILHGPIGQLFYKKVIAMKVFGQVFTSYPMFFFAYMGITLAAAAAVQQFLMPRDSWFNKLSASATGKLVGLFPSAEK
jgi:peptidoglycan/LPS O-acetylase OafA/YrhL